MAGGPGRPEGRLDTIVFGAGAVGGLVAARLALHGASVGVVARGAHAEAIARDGLGISEGGSVRRARVTVLDRTGATPPPAVLVLGLKAQSIPGALVQIGPLVGSDTLVVPLLNGVPWWYFQGLAGPLEGRTVEAVDPGGAIAAAIPADRVIGCVVYLAADVPEPGLVRLNGDNRLILGEPAAPGSARLDALARRWTEVGFSIATAPDIRREIWAKLWGNLAYNPLSALTGGDGLQLADDPAVGRILRAMMDEGRAVAESQGQTMPMTTEQRIGLARRLGPFRTSMLQDMDRGRSIELDGVLGSVLELARLGGVPVPTLETVYALTRLRAMTAGCWPTG